MIIEINKTNELEKDFVTLKRNNSIFEIFNKNEDKVGETKLPLKLNQYKGKVVEISDSTVKIQVITYIPLHSHSGYSLLDGAIKIKDLVDATEYCGALTDHGSMYGFLKFYKSMKKAGKKPIIGFEAYTEDFYGEKQSNHMVLLAKNEIGFRNLMSLTSQSFNNFYKKPHVSIDMLKQYSEGLIGTTACLGGLIPKLILKGDIEEAEKAIIEFKNIFSDGDFYIELQRHGMEDEKVVEPVLIELAKKHNLKIIATNDAHYFKEEDAYAHEILLCLQTKKTIHEDHWKFDGTGFHYMNSEDMEKLFSDMPEVLDNTLELADKCNVELKLNDIKMPDYEIPSKFKDGAEYFECLCYEGFKERFGNSDKYTSSEYIDRLKYEIAMIKQMNFEKYFLIVWDFINFAMKNDILVGPGRGSAVGSLVSYCLHTTDIDPIKYGLLFERFLNPERVSWPDIDTDFDYGRRSEVFSYLTDKYGVENVCKIITIGTEGAKMIVRDVTRVLGHPVSLGNKIAKLIPAEVGMTISKAMDKNPEFKLLYDTDSSIKEIVDISLKLEGLPRHTSVNACGFIISGDNITSNVPTALTINKETKLKETTSQVDKIEVEELGLLKMDLLGLRTLGVVKNSFKLIKERYGIDLKMSDISLDDRKVYKYLQEGNTGGVFQFESPGITALLKNIYQDIDVLPEKDLNQLFPRLIAANALYRPGPMDCIPDYIKNMNNPDNIHYDHPMLESILKETYGVIVYQEQVMKVVQKLAGYTLGRADIVRKAMGKKQQEIMDKEEKVFIYGNLNDKSDKVKVKGCIANGISEKIAKEIWNKMAKFAQYAFNKSHATAYAYLAVITAWLSYYYPSEFNVSLLNSVLDNADKLSEYLSQCYKKNIEILSPDVNLSEMEFTLENNSIRFGLGGLKSVSKSGNELIEVRNHIPFKDLHDFIKRLGENGSLNKSLFEALTYSGALDCFNCSRHAKIENIKLLMDNAAMWSKNQNSNQVSLFDISNDYVKIMKIEIKDSPEFTDLYKLKKEKEYAGFYLTGHPLDNYDNKLKAIKTIRSIDSLLQTSSVSVRSDIETVGLIADIKLFWTKKVEQMATFKLQDNFNDISCVVFPNELSINRENIIEDKIVIVKGNLQESEDYGTQIIIKDIYDIDTYLETRSVPQYITVSISNKQEQNKLFKIIDSHVGDDTFIIISANNKKYPLKKKIKYSPKVITLLKDNFEKVNAS